MRSQIFKISLVALFFLFLSFPAQAANPFDVVINEVAWMGTEASYNDEWIELKNNTDKAVNLEGWVLKAVDGTPEIKLTGDIPINGFYLLERTDDKTLPDIAADQVYTGALNNGGENLELYDNLGNLIDSVDCSSGWFAGNNQTKQTMERIDGASWGTSQNPGGTPRAENSTAAETGSPLVPEPEPQIELETTTTPQSASSQSLQAEPEATSTPPEPEPVSYPSGIVINEILPSPEGPDAEEEWVEIYNTNDFEVDLSGWKIKDLVGKTNTYTFPEETVISPWGFLVLPRPATGITLNNGGDGLSLTQPNGEILYSVNYEKAPRGESFNRTEDEWTWSKTPTPGSINIIPAAEKTSLLESKDKPSEVKPQSAMAAVGGQPHQSSNSRLTVSIALAFAVFFGTIILILKKKTKTIV